MGWGAAFSVRSPEEPLWTTGRKPEGARAAGWLRRPEEEACSSRGTSGRKGPEAEQRGGQGGCIGAGGWGQSGEEAREL